MIGQVCEVIKECTQLGVQVGVVVGGGNFWRGLKDGGDRGTGPADHMGMLATSINALALADVLEQKGVDVRVRLPSRCGRLAEPISAPEPSGTWTKGRVVIFGCGTGNPFFSTDTASALRAAEIEADIIFKASMVDGVYDSDPKKNPDAVKFDRLSFLDVLNKDLKVMDSTAATLCKDNEIPILVFNLEDPENIVRAVRGETIGTIVE